MFWLYALYANHVLEETYRNTRRCKRYTCKDKTITVGQVPVRLCTQACSILRYVL